MNTNQNRICVANREINMYDDSEFLSTFLIEGTDQFEEVQIGSTRYGGGSYFTKVNASEEVKEMYRTWLCIQSSIKESKMIRVGKKCMIKGSRKNKDKVGIIDWIGDSHFEYNVTLVRVNFPDYYTQEVSIARIVLV